ncbi:unnamed protein product [Symbiodinium microadriaticum]|nr:unnamed protein product [Symbiodinium microadriaticum]
MQRAEHLRAELKRLEHEIAREQHACNCEFGEPISDPIVTPNMVFSHYEGVGSDPNPVMKQSGNKTKPRWKRVCEKCGKVEYTEKLRWPGNCHAIACMMLKSGIVRGRATYGHYHGFISELSEPFGSRAGGFTHHGWITRKKTIVDPTRWVFEACDPYIYVGPKDDEDYDMGGNRVRHMIMKPPPDFDKKYNSWTVPRHLLPFTQMMLNFESDVICAPQVMWLANLPLDMLGDMAEPVFKWIAEETTMIEKTFTGEKDWEAVRAAEAWCEENGISVGTMQGGSPRGLKRGVYHIHKWRNLSRDDRNLLDGTMEGDIIGTCYEPVPTFVFLHTETPMRLDRKYGDLSPGDNFIADSVEYLVLDNPLEDELRNNGMIFNAVSLDGSKKRFFEDDARVQATRIKVHVLDLRAGDQITMAENIDVAYGVSTVLRVRDDKGYRHATIARPLIHGSQFGTTCPGAHLYLNQYDTMARVDDYKRDEYYYVIGIDTSALFDANSFNFSADKFRFAVYLRANGDKREMAELLITDYRTLREAVMGLVMGKHKNREDVMEFPDRKDSAEAEYHKNLLDRLTNEGDLTEAEFRYLNVQNALDRRFDDAEVRVLNKARKV